MILVQMECHFSAGLDLCSWFLNHMMLVKAGPSFD